MVALFLSSHLVPAGSIRRRRGTVPNHMQHEGQFTAQARQAPARVTERLFAGRPRLGGRGGRARVAPAHPIPCRAAAERSGLTMPLATENADRIV